MSMDHQTSLQTTASVNHPSSILTPPQRLSPSESSTTASSYPNATNSSQLFDDFQPRLLLPSFHSLLESLRGEREAHRNIMEIHRDSLRAAERTISLLREQIRLHDERARISISSFVLPAAPVGRTTRTPTQQAALERSLSSRIATLQDEQRRQQLIQQLRVASLGLMRRPELDGLRERDNLLTSSRNSSLRSSNQQDSNLNGCPIPTYSIVTSARTHYLFRESADRWIGAGERENILAPSSTFCSRFSNEDVDYQGYSSGSASNQEALEREWERQLADGEVDTNGVPILKPHQIHSFIPPGRTRTHSSRFTSTHLGTRKVDGLGLQLATVCSNPQSPDSLTTSAAHSFHPLCLR